MESSCNDGITIFKVNKATGMLTEVGFQPTDKHPRQFNITPNGELLLCASRDNNTIQVFKINQNTGALTNLNKDIKVDKAVCVQFSCYNGARHRCWRLSSY